MTTAKGGFFAMAHNFQIQRIEKFYQGFLCTVTVGATPCTMMCIGVASHDEIEIFVLTIPHEFLKFLCRRRILGVIWQISGTNHQLSFCPIFNIFN
jgi:hypothetical protein